MVMYDGDNTYKGNPLFRGAIMNSGSLVPADPPDSPKGQGVYDSVVAAAGCSSAADTLECLRELPYEQFLNAVNSPAGILSYTGLEGIYIPRPDGVALTQAPQDLLQQKKIAIVPFIIGDQEDEGTLFALFLPNVTSTDEIINYFTSNFFAHASTDVISTFVHMYDNWLTYGSPFRTGILNNLFPCFKRLAAMLGDIAFTLTRRITLTMVNELFPEVPKWTYLSSYDYGTPVMGTFHASDIIQVWFGVRPDHASSSFRNYYINFANNLDPNEGATDGLSNWPQWTDPNQQQMLQMYADYDQLIEDNFRSDVFEFLSQNVTTFSL